MTKIKLPLINFLISNGLRVELLRQEIATLEE